MQGVRPWRLFATGFLALCNSQYVVLSAQNRTAEALAFQVKGYQAQVDFFKRQAKRKPDNPAWQEQLAQALLPHPGYHLCACCTGAEAGSSKWTVRSPLPEARCRPSPLYATA